MKRTTLALAVVALAGCELQSEQKAALAAATLAQIQILNDQGYDPVALDPEQLAILATGCALAPFALPERAADIALLCGPVLKAAGEAQ